MQKPSSKKFDWSSSNRMLGNPWFRVSCMHGITTMVK